ncbi:hypothetical protein DC429_03700 [Arthrobacter sp. TPD3018]|nr:hypothetical protein DC425_03695 [Sphingomonas sp. TPD3009]PVE61036.1 hypothetical protein DC429_03700 [Arthrobacter sp. TPD3018]PVE86049.1 hypothetical protein DC431_09480 [Sphingomonas melonis]
MARTLTPPTRSPRARSGVHRATGAAFEPFAAPLAAKWTPERVRGDEPLGANRSPHRPHRSA